jgi:tetratricopeptide (TPR) repeat protein
VNDIDPSFEVMYAIALGYYKLKNFNQTFKYLQMCKDMTGADIRVQLLTAKYYRKKGDLNKALDFLITLQKEGPENIEVLYLIADVYRLKGCFNNAKQYCDVGLLDY